MALTPRGVKIDTTITTDGDYALGSFGSGPTRVSLTLVGTWDSATIKIQFSDDDGSTWVDLPTASWTADTSVIVWLGGRDRIYQFNSNGTSGSTDVDATLRS